MSDFQGPTQSGAYGVRRSDTMYQAREAAKREAAKSPLEKRVDALEKILSNGGLFNCGAGINIAGDLRQGFAANVNFPPPPQNVDTFDGYPWIESILDPDATSGDQFYDVVFGNGSSSFSDGSADAIKAFEMEVLDPDDDTASGMSILVGDTDDHLGFTGSGNSFNISWVGGILMQGTDDDTSAFRLKSGEFILTSNTGATIDILPFPGMNVSFQQITIDGVTFYAFQ